MLIMESVMRQQTNLQPVTPVSAPSTSTPTVPTVLPEQTKAEKPKTTKPKQPTIVLPWKRFTFECPIELIDKIHNISWKEHVTINSLLAKMLRDGIRSYERKHGVAEAKKRSADELY